MDINIFLNRINEFIINPIILLLFVIALIVFFWGLVEFIRNAGSEDGRVTGRRNMMYGIIGIFIMVSVYGIISFILNTFGLNSPDYIGPRLH